MRQFLFVFILIAITAISAAALTPAAVGGTDGSSVSRHYDPSHPGHKHRCNNCGALYHQPGDEYANSPGSYRCPHCGFQNAPSGPAGPGVTPPDNPPYNPPYNPPQPPPPSYGPNADQIIAHAKRAATYAEGDRILVAGARQLNDARGVLRIAAEAWNDSNRRTILKNFNENRPWQNPPDYSFLSVLYDRMSSYQAGDDLILYSARLVYSLRDMVYLATKIYSSGSARDYMNQMARRSDFQGQTLSLEDVRQAYSRFSTYQAGDQLLLSVMNFFHGYDALMRLSELAWSSSVRRQIQDRAFQSGGSYNWGNGSYRAVHAPVKKEPCLAIDLAREEITLENLDKIEVFIRNLKKGAFKPSPLRDTTEKLVRDFLRGVWMQNQDERVKELIELMK